MLGFGSYETAWAWLHKLRRAMVRPDRDMLGGPGVTVEMDQTFFGGRVTTRVAPQYVNKEEVAIAVELRHPTGFGRVRLAVIESAQRRIELDRFARTIILPGTLLHTDGATLYKNLTRAMGVTHERSVLEDAKENAHEVLPGVHRVSSLLKRWPAGTLHNGRSAAHLGYYLDEFTFRFNRRASQSRGLCSTASYNKR